MLSSTCSDALCDPFTGKVLLNCLSGKCFAYCCVVLSSTCWHEEDEVKRITDGHIFQEKFVSDPWDLAHAKPILGKRKQIPNGALVHPWAENCCVFQVDLTSAENVRDLYNSLLIKKPTTVTFQAVVCRVRRSRHHSLPAGQVGEGVYSSRMNLTVVVGWNSPLLHEGFLRRAVHQALRSRTWNDSGPQAQRAWHYWLLENSMPCISETEDQDLSTSIERLMRWRTRTLIPIQTTHFCCVVFQKRK